MKILTIRIHYTTPSRHGALRKMTVLHMKALSTMTIDQIYEKALKSIPSSGRLYGITLDNFEESFYYE